MRAPLGDGCSCIIHAGKSLHRLRRVKPHHVHEFYLFPDRCAQPLDTQEGENFVLEQGLIGVGVMRAGVAVPNSRNYSPSPILPQSLHLGARSRNAEFAMTASTSSRRLKSTEWLAGQLGKKDVAIVDGSYYLPTQRRDARAEYLAGHIPGAVFFDINAVADNSVDLPHMLPG